MKTMAIVADSSFVIETIRLALRNTAGLKLLGKVDGRADVRGAIGHAQPDVILVDEMQNAEDALERIRECREQTPDSSILLLTMRMEDERSRGRSTPASTPASRRAPTSRASAC